jgi:nonsense-mediated mRNA decay protein 3
MILPNSANQCSTCLAQELDVQSQLMKGASHFDGNGLIKIFQCRKCRRFQQTDKKWEHLEPESPELLTICLKKLPALSKDPNLQLVDAMWVWTEPHSMRLKMRVTVRAVTQNVPIQQRVLVEFKVEWKQCPDCNREYTNRVRTYCAYYYLLLLLLLLSFGLLF